MVVLREPQSQWGRGGGNPPLLALGQLFPRKSQGVQQHPGKWLFTGKRTQPWPGRRWKEEGTTLNTGKDGAPGAHPGEPLRQSLERDVLCGDCGCPGRGGDRRGGEATAEEPAFQAPGSSWSGTGQPGSRGARPAAAAPRQGDMVRRPRPAPGPGQSGDSRRASKARCQPGASRLCQGTGRPRSLSNPPPSRSPR